MVKDWFRQCHDALYRPHFKLAYRIALPLCCMFSTLWLLETSWRDSGAVLSVKNTKRVSALEVYSSKVVLSETSRPVSVEPAVYSSSDAPDVTVWPISFSAPETTWIPVVPAKSVDFATIIPGNLSTYVYDDETSYYEGYRSARFAVTRKKAGWDCMRHLEIMANGAVPYFPDFDEMPRLTMQHYPKALFREARTFPGVHFRGNVNDPASYYVNESEFNFDKYFDLASEILKFSREHLTTRAMALYILQVVGVQDPNALRQVLIVTHCVDDYLQDATLHGLKLVLGKRLIDVVPESHKYANHACVEDTSPRGERFPEYRVNMYMDSWAAASQDNFATRRGYGKGFTLWNKLNFKDFGDVNRSNICQRTLDGSFDLVLLSDHGCARGEPRDRELHQGERPESKSHHHFRW